MGRTTQFGYPGCFEIVFDSPGTARYSVFGVVILVSAGQRHPNFMRMIARGFARLLY